MMASFWNIKLMATSEVTNLILSEIKLVNLRKSICFLHAATVFF
jgi:hypothetical protein